MKDLNFKETSEKYRNEMMKLYGAKFKMDNIKKEEPDSEIKIEYNEKIEDNKKKFQKFLMNRKMKILKKNIPPPEIPVFMQLDSTSTRPQTEAVINYNNGQTNNISKKREAETPNYNIQNAPQHSEIPQETPPSSNPLENKWGYLKITVRTGSNGIPVPNASVTVSRRYDGKRRNYQYDYHRYKR